MIKRATHLELPAFLPKQQASGRWNYRMNAMGIGVRPIQGKVIMPVGGAVERPHPGPFLGRADHFFLARLGSVLIDRNGTNRRFPITQNVQHGSSSITRPHIITSRNAGVSRRGQYRGQNSYRRQKKRRNSHYRFLCWVESKIECAWYSTRRLSPNLAKQMASVGVAQPARHLLCAAGRRMVARRIPVATACRIGSVRSPRCTLPDTPCRRISHTARCVHESCQVVSGQTASTASSTRHFAMCGTWPAIVSGNRRPDSRPLQSATIARPEGHPLNYPAGRGNWWRITESNRALPEASGLQSDGFAASLTLRKRCAWYSARRLANSTSGRPILVQPRVLVLPKMPSQPILWPSAFTAAVPSI